MAPPIIHKQPQNFNIVVENNDPNRLYCHTSGSTDVPTSLSHV